MANRQTDELVPFPPVKLGGTPYLITRTVDPDHLDVSMRYNGHCSGDRVGDFDSQFTYKVFDRYGLATSGTINKGVDWTSDNITIPLSGNPPYVIGADRVGCMGVTHMHGIVEKDRLYSDDIDYAQLNDQNILVNVTVPAGETYAETSWTPPEPMLDLAVASVHGRSGASYGTLHFQNPANTTVIRYDRQPLLSGPYQVGPWFLIDDAYQLSLDLTLAHDEPSTWTVEIKHFSLVPDICRYGPFEWGMCTSE